MRICRSINIKFCSTKKERSSKIPKMTAKSLVCPSPGTYQRDPAHLPLRCRFVVVVVVVEGCGQRIRTTIKEDLWHFGLIINCSPIFCGLVSGEGTT
ncbi:hypothetical protein RB195_011412 [Necator americanus]|uniref:Uncharacterized protein n=1 Tax=Necator americanus TaxID=51031 RepID=A0ABR1D3L7_NECAM